MPARQPKPERHRCPPWCHECPDIVDGFMPWCEGGGLDGIEGCHCSHEDPHLDADTISRAVWFAEEYRRELIRRPMDELSKRRRARP